jgi:hypothetical protein
MAVDDFLAPLETAARTTFLTARAAGRHMIPRRSGVILAFGGPGDRSGPMRDYYLGGTQVAFDAIETIRRQLAVELGPHGIRVVTLASGGIPESLPEGLDGRKEIVEMIERQTLLGRAATLEDVGNAAVFAASDASCQWGATSSASGQTDEPSSCLCGQAEHGAPPTPDLVSEGSDGAMRGESRPRSLHEPGQVSPPPPSAPRASALTTLTPATEKWLPNTPVARAARHPNPDLHLPLGPPLSRRYRSRRSRLSWRGPSGGALCSSGFPDR